ncbi:MAG TPA: hypothetical protein VFS11_10550 [Gemmatimonadales bacterium]|nr:hypothetical protein [Gemmatimonadales bacterium]
MAELLDRLNRELGTIGRRAQAAIGDGKLQLELLRLRRMQDNAARDLGLLVHRRERGRDVDLRRIDSLLFRLDDLETQIGRVEAELAERRRTRQASPAESTPSPVPTPPPTGAAGAAGSDNTGGLS